MDIDYQKLKFMAGLEIHQQLDSSKLFCNCPSVLRKDEPDFVVSRKLHAVAGEGGEVDAAALHEAALGKEFVYQGYDTTCLVELDEEPPHMINEEALETALHISLLLHCKVVPVTQIMRKTVVDGSNTGGFQRTLLVARDGWIETSKGKVGINYVYLEEDAARIVERESEKVIYRLDRLGIPLVEVVTAPDLKDAEHAKEVALQIGDILRSCKVRRGIGTIRQDVNVSIRGENRVEIKGMQDMNIFVKAIENEIERQEKLSDSRKPTEMEVRNVLPDASTEFMRPLPGSARMYPETDLPLLKISREMVNDAKRGLPKLRSEVEKDLKKQGLTEEMTGILMKSGKLNLFKELVDILKNPGLVAKILLVYPKELASKLGIDVGARLHGDSLHFVAEALAEGKLLEENIKEALRRIVDGTRPQDAVVFKKTDVSGLDEKVLKIIKDKPGLSEKAYMGLVMKEFRGKVSGKEAMEIIKKHVN